MLAIFKREINAFFTSAIGYLVIGVFLVLNGLFLWIFKGDFNVFDYGFADLSPFFLLAPWVLLFLIPAITMKSFADEKKLGTLELLLIKPISHWQIVLGKYLGSFMLVIIALLPTLLYILSIWKLGNPEGNLDMGSTIGSYIGLLFLAATYTAIGVFTSSLTENQIVAFILAVITCFAFYYGFEALSDTFQLSFIENIGIKAHFNSIARGVIDTRDCLYFISITFLFLYATMLNLKKEHKK